MGDDANEICSTWHLCAVHRRSGRALLILMRAFTCPSCQFLVPFEALVCLHCSSELAYSFDQGRFVVLEGGCANRALLACNGAAAGGWCASCTLTRHRSEGKAVLDNLAKAEQAKRRLLFSLLDLGLPVESWRVREGGLAFDLLDSADQPVVIGHADGVITLDLAEADDAHRAHVRITLDEPYRTLLGHLRHEVGHYYEDLLVGDRASYRDLFGDERESYQDAIDRHYASGPPQGWQASYVSAYATMHPFEDWAETFAHYLHLRDTLQTAQAWGVNVVGPDAADLAPLHSFPALASDFASLMDAWIPMTYALNALNRSMGARDLYPFVLAGPIIDKLAYVDAQVRASRP
jgi:hypothetical protein